MKEALLVSTLNLKSNLSMRLMPRVFALQVRGIGSAWAGEIHLKCPLAPQSSPHLLLFPFPQLPPPPIPIPACAVDHLRRRSQSSAPQTTVAGRAGAGAAAGPGAAHFRGGNGGIKHTVAYPIDVQDMQEQGQSRCTHQQAGTAGNRLSRIRKDKYG